MIKTTLVSAYYQNEAMTKDFLDNLVGKLPKGTEVILVNAGSAPIDHPLVDIRVDLPENQSFSNSMNAGIVLATGDYICVIGNDVFPETEDWLARLVALAERTGAMITSPTNDKSNLPSYQLEPVENYFEVKEMFPAVCWLLSREAIDIIGLFDEDFKLGTYEDNLYCYQVLKAGGKIVLDPQINVRHLVSQTMKLFDIGMAMAHNRVLFEQKKR